MGKDIDWNDEETEKEMDSGNVERYTASEGRKDLIRILTAPHKYYIHNLSKLPWYCNCGKADGKTGRCILCERDMDRAVKIGVVIVHIASKGKDDSKFQPVGTCKVWLFGKDKMKSIRSLLEDYADGDATKWLTKQDLFVTCNEEKFQDLEIRWTTKPSRVTKENVKDLCANFKSATEKLEWYTKSSDIKRQKECLGMSVDDEVDEDDIGAINDDDQVDDIGLGGIDDTVGDVDDSMANNPEEPLKDEMDDLLDGMDNNGKVPF